MRHTRASCPRSTERGRSLSSDHVHMAPSPAPVAIWIAERGWPIVARGCHARPVIRSSWACMVPHGVALGILHRDALPDQLPVAKREASGEKRTTDTGRSAATWVPRFVYDLSGSSTV